MMMLGMPMFGVFAFSVLTLGPLVTAHTPRPLTRLAQRNLTAFMESAGMATAAVPDIHHFNARCAHPEHVLLRRIGLRRRREGRDGCQHKQNRGWSCFHS
jgi:hypothetical protein